MFDPLDDVAREARRVNAHALLDAVLDVQARTAVGAELTFAVEARAALGAIVDGAVVGIVAQWEASADWARDGSASVVTAMVNRTGAHRSAAGALRRTGLDAASMPHVSAAAAEGVLPLTHLHLLTRAREEVVAEVFDRDEHLLVAEARCRTADSLSRWLRAWRYGALQELGRNEPDSSPGPDTEADTAKIITGFAGRGIIELDVTPVTLAKWTEAVQARIETWRRTGQLSEDTRSWPELVADALSELIADGSTSSRRGLPRPLLIVLAKLGELFDRANIPADQREPWTARIVGGGPIGHTALRELMEQANVQLVVTNDDGEPLYVGRARRLATAAMLIALLARSGGTCEFPGCHATHHRANAHHIRSWRNGGETDLNNFALLCPHHHRLVHHGWTLTRGPTGLIFHKPDGTPINPPPYQQAA